MRSSISTRFATVAILLAVSTPVVARAQNVWDLVALGATGGALGTTRIFTNGLFGSITGTVTNVADNLYAKDFGQPLTDGEHGIGLCQATGSQDDDEFKSDCKGRSSFEIGDYGSDGILFKVSLNSGYLLSGFTLSSAQAGEKWKVGYKTTATCNTSTVFSTFYTGTGPTRGSDFVDQSSTANCFEFLPNGGTGGMDYLVESFTTIRDGGGTPQSVVPEPATMTMLATGLVGIAGAQRRRRRKA